MKIIALRLILLLSLAGALATARADNPGNGKSDQAKENKENKSDKPERPNNGNSGNGGGASKPDDKDLKAEFKAQAEAFQKQQKDLLNKLKNANSEERTKIREQLVVLKENWRELNKEFRDKLDDLKEKVDRENLKEERGGGRPRK